MMFPFAVVVFIDFSCPFLVGMGLVRFGCCQRRQPRGCFFGKHSNCRVGDDGVVGGDGDDDGAGNYGTGETPIRARLSPSPATGLVGLRENVFIGEFFSMMGFLPFTTERWVRVLLV